MYQFDALEENHSQLLEERAELGEHAKRLQAHNEVLVTERTQIDVQLCQLRGDKESMQKEIADLKETVTAEQRKYEMAAKSHSDSV